MKVLKWLDNNLEQAILLILLCGMTIVMGGQIIARYAFSASLSYIHQPEKVVSFIRLPNFLFEAPTFTPLSNEAKVLYAFILRRTDLSRKTSASSVPICGKTDQRNHLQQMCIRDRLCHETPFPIPFLSGTFPQENPAENISDRIGMDKI